MFTFVCWAQVDGPSVGKLPDVDRLDFRGTTDGEGHNSDTVRSGRIDPPRKRQGIVDEEFHYRLVEE